MAQKKKVAKKTTRKKAAKKKAASKKAVAKSDVDQEVMQDSYEGIEQLPLKSFAEKSYLDYSMYVILQLKTSYPGSWPVIPQPGRLFLPTIFCDQPNVSWQAAYP